jgi:hypothetical protein
MEAAAGSGLGQVASGSGQAEASTRKRSQAAADQGKRVSEISGSDIPKKFFPAFLRGPILVKKVPYTKSKVLNG